MTKTDYYEADILARTIFGEAEAGNLADATAVAAVVMNRVNYPNWPNTVSAVCLQPWQFSCWNHNDPNRDRILKASGKWFTECQKIAEAAISGEFRDPTNVATHYYATYVKEPRWAKGKTPVYAVPHKNGHSHLFYNDIDTPPPQSVIQTLEADRPLGSTRTIKGAHVATGGILASTLTEVLTDTQERLIPLLPIIEPLKWVFVGMALMGIAVMVYARIDDRRKGLR